MKLNVQDNIKTETHILHKNKKIATANECKFIVTKETYTFEQFNGCNLSNVVDGNITFYLELRGINIVEYVDIFSILELDIIVNSKKYSEIFYNCHWNSIKCNSLNFDLEFEKISLVTNMRKRIINQSST